VFENLQLASFGNRIPFMTFEVLADGATPTVASILNDASDGRIVANEGEAVIGFAAYGGSIARALDPLVSMFGIPLFDDGSALVTRSAATFVEVTELGSSADGTAPSHQRERLSSDSAPATLRLTYYDPSRDYQAGHVSASAGEPLGTDVQEDLPVVLAADQAKSIAQRIIAREWGGLERLTLRLPPRRIGLEPGTVISSLAAPGAWVIEKATIDGFVTVVELRRDSRPSVAVAGDGGRAVAAVDVVEAPASLAVLDIPDVTGSGARSPVVAIAASSSSIGWRRRTLKIRGPGLSIAAQSARRKSILGHAINVLAAGAPELIDEINAVDVQLIDSDQWLTSCEDVALSNGANQAVLGSEIVQFGVATALGNGRFRLSRLLRGRAGTEWAKSSPAVNETFCMLDADRLALVEVPVAARGATLTVKDDRGSSGQSRFNAEALRPFAPAFLKAAMGPAGVLEISWIRRSRSGLAWLDDVDVPLAESAEQYRVVITGTGGVAEFTTSLQALTVAGDALSPLGSGSADISVTQTGDFVASRPAIVAVTLS
jgi:hypothetical protein